ncbi:hypothetical protein GGD81_003312 [Rhodobium orientis]|uniref:Sulfotransferase domain-containing protein n=1 Tax=Rhodobium orientis TaxID=34017 RepID=A0A327JTG8_9HYPH|nr:hypothetical protein [Rhodobium orientis]MBB4304254.1 hypothetical protein [Rhodobium orientis]MBK5948250.1 hypothetical protein [Rhodobium orientis]RAI28764.1 hypothetical protein CH339_04995 [Rhodobium orientis]
MSTTYIHIGVPKTGSTAIQHFATENRQLLREKGLLYPSAALRGFGHHDVAFLLNGGYPDWAKPQDRPLGDLAGALRSECLEFDGDVLLSSENFYLFPQPERLFEFVRDTGLLEGRAVKVIVYLRRQDDLLVSWYNQLVKAQGFSGTFADALHAQMWLGDYRSQLARWSNAFGRETMLVRRYPSQDVDGPGLMSDFWGLACPAIAADAQQAMGQSTNVSLNRDLLEIQRIINRLPLEIVEKRRFHHELMKLTTQMDGFFSDAPVASGAELDDLLAGFEDGNGEVARIYFDGGPLFEKPPRAREPERPYGGVEADKAVAALAWMLLSK